MDYPLKVGHALTFDGDPLTIFEPDPLVREAAELLTSRSLVMDMGIGRFQNSLFLAEQGHIVHGIEKDFGLANDALRLRQFIGGWALNCHVEPGDVTEVPLGSEAYGAVVATLILQELTPEAQDGVLETMRRITKPGGLNIIRAYVATERDQIALPQLSLYEPGELERLYFDEGWLIEKAQSSNESLIYEDGGVRCSATDQLVARKPFSADERA